MQHIRGVNGPILGKFRLAAVTGLTTGFVANSSIFDAQFAPTGNVRAVITDLRLKAQLVTPFTSANEYSAQAFIARSWTSSPTGGTLISISGLQNMLSSVSDAPYTSAFTSIRVCNTSSLGNGTFTLDTVPLLYLPAAQVLAAASAAGEWHETALGPISDQRFGINLQGQTGGIATNAEGIAVQVPIAQGAGGVVRYCVEMEWYEYATNSAETIG